jgi:hypothetical protein
MPTRCVKSALTTSFHRANCKQKQEVCLGMRRDVVSTHQVTRHNTPIQNILSTAPQLSISQKAQGTLPEDDNVSPKHVGASIHN